MPSVCGVHWPVFRYLPLPPPVAIVNCVLTRDIQLQGTWEGI